MRNREERRKLNKIKFISKLKKVFNEYGKFQVETWDKLMSSTKWAKLYKSTRTWEKKLSSDKTEIHIENRKARKQAKKDITNMLLEEL